MKLKTLFIISAAVLALLGLGLIFFLEPLMLARTGSVPNILTAHVARQFGTAILAISVISWLSRNSGNSSARNAVVIGLTVLFVLLPIETVFAIARGSESQEGYLLVVIFGLLAVGFILIGKPSFSRRQNKR